MKSLEGQLKAFGTQRDGDFQEIEGLILYWKDRWWGCSEEELQAGWRGAPLGAMSLCALALDNEQLRKQEGFIALMCFLLEHHMPIGPREEDKLLGLATHKLNNAFLSQAATEKAFSQLKRLLARGVGEGASTSLPGMSLLSEQLHMALVSPPEELIAGGAQARTSYAVKLRKKRLKERDKQYFLTPGEKRFFQAKRRLVSSLIAYGADPGASARGLEEAPNAFQHVAQAPKLPFLERLALIDLMSPGGRDDQAQGAKEQVKALMEATDREALCEERYHLRERLGQLQAQYSSGSIKEEAFKSRWLELEQERTRRIEELDIEAVLEELTGPAGAVSLLAKPLDFVGHSAGAQGPVYNMKELLVRLGFFFFFSLEEESILNSSPAEAGYGEQTLFFTTLLAHAHHPEAAQLVALLLDHGADPNTVSRAGAPLLTTLLRLEEVEHPVWPLELPEAAVEVGLQVPLPETRKKRLLELLLAHGAHPQMVDAIATQQAYAKGMQEGEITCLGALFEMVDSPPTQRLVWARMMIQNALFDPEQPGCFNPQAPEKAVRPLHRVIGDQDLRREAAPWVALLLARGARVEEEDIRLARAQGHEPDLLGELEEVYFALYPERRPAPIQEESDYDPSSSQATPEPVLLPAGEQETPFRKGALLFAVGGGLLFLVIYSLAEEEEEEEELDEQVGDKQGDDQRLELAPDRRTPNRDDDQDSQEEADLDDAFLEEGT